MDLEQNGCKDEVQWGGSCYHDNKLQKFQETKKVSRLLVTIIFFKNEFAQWTQCSINIL